MQKKPLVLLLVLVLVVGALGALYWFGGDGRGGEGPARPTERGAARTQEQRPAGALAELEEEAAPESAPAAPTRTEGRAVAGGTSGDRTGFSTESARWVDVHVLLPAGRPLDDEPLLVAIGNRAEDAFAIEWVLRRMAGAIDLGDGYLDEFSDAEQTLARRVVPEDGRLRVPFHSDARSGVLVLVSRYVAADPVVLELASVEGPVQVETSLGAWLTGRVVVPEDHRERIAEGDGLELEIEGRGEGGFLFGQGGPGDRRAPRLSEDLAFEVRALSAERRYSVRLEADGLIDHTELRLELEPGEHRVYDIVLEEGAVVSGRVLDAGRQPVEGVHVEARVDGGPLTMLMGGQESAITDAAGNFRVSGLPGGELALNASHEGFLEAHVSDLEVAERGRLDGVELVLDRGSMVRGQVLWPDGTPAADADVTVSQPERGGWRNQVGEVTTRDDGTFSITGLGEGPFDLFVECVPPGEEEEREEAAPVLEGQEFVGALDGGSIRGMQAVVLGSGSAPNSWFAQAHGVAAGALLSLTLEPPLTLRGVVRDDAGAPVTSFRASARPAADARWSSVERFHAFEEEDGSFELPGLFPGEWTVSANAPGYVATEEEGPTVRIPQGGAPVVLVLQRAVVATGTVVDPLGNPVAGATVQTSDDSSRSMETRTDEEGRFELEDCPPSGMALVASHEDWAPSEPVAVVAAPGTLEAEVVLPLRVGGTITGEVYDAEGEPEAGAQVTAGSMGEFDMFGEGPLSDTTDAQGTFRIEHVPPGQVTVFVSPDEDQILDTLEEGTANEAVFFDIFGQMRMETVEVADGEEVHVVLGAKPRSPVRITGVVREAGEPVPGAMLMVFEEGGAMMQGMKMARVDDEGAFEVTVDRPGDFVFQLQDPESGMGAQVYLTVPEVEELHQDLELPTGRIEGLVLDPDGLPAGGVSVSLSRAGGIRGFLDLAVTQGQVTAADGRFAVEHLSPGEYAVHAGGGGAFGQETPRYGTAVVGGLVVEEGGSVSDVLLRLDRGGALVGRVVDASGTPIAGASIYVREAGGHLLTDITGCTSDAAGEFRYAGVPSGAITAFARKGELVSGESAPLEVPGGGETSVDLVVDAGSFLVVELLRDGDPVRARVEVLDGDGRRVSGLFSEESIESLLMEGLDSREHRVGPLVPGTYELHASAPDGAQAKKRVSVRPGQEERRVKLRLR